VQYVSGTLVTGYQTIWWQPVGLTRNLHHCENCKSY